MPSIPARVRSISLPPFDVLNTKAANLRAAGHDVITLGQGVPGFGPPAVGDRRCTPGARESGDSPLLR